MHDNIYSFCMPICLLKFPEKPTKSSCSEFHTTNYAFSFLLDDTTGINSIYTVYQGHELMFHVSTMLPYSKENKQQVGLITIVYYYYCYYFIWCFSKRR